MEIWRVNARTEAFTREPVPETWSRLGGRALLARIMVDEMDAACDPLGPGNKLIFAPGLLVGYHLSSCDRISIGGKSPLTGGVKESNAGGRTGLQLIRLGIKALIVEDRPDTAGWRLIHLGPDGARFEDAGEYAGLGVYVAAPRLIEKYGDKIAAALIGPAGERMLKAAGIQNLDKDEAPSRIAARGGLGAVMGSKRIKAIVIDGSQGENPPAADPAGLKDARKRYIKGLLEHPQTQSYKDYGTAAMTMMCNTFGALPVRNFSAGSFEHAEQLSGEHLRDTLLQRGGDCDPSHPCMAGCTIQSSNIFVTLDGGTKVSPLEYETIGLMGSNLGIADLDVVARLNWEVNDLGLDTIDVGAALGVAADAGLLDFGDGDRALELVGEIRRGTDLGSILGNGAAATGKALGVERVPVVKNQAFSAYDPRAIKGTGVTYATSPQGADHTSGLTIRANVDHRDPRGQMELSRGRQIDMAGYDSLGACIFAAFGYSVDTSVIPGLLNSIYGWDLGESALQDLGRESLAHEREFNRRAGFTEKDDRLPEWVTKEALSPHGAVFDVPDEDLDSVFDW
ncbi:MAG TPA: aldehyde ferredoxin oxidoreductase C-terminal domain-containing protein [Anaerolineales bacterium]|nr:aldehyde ferredoxin oxidoreductase C-terminal domain-containing protein [Anaerolineales bacterium]